MIVTNPWRVNYSLKEVMVGYGQKTGSTFGSIASILFYWCELIDVIKPELGCVDR